MEGAVTVDGNGTASHWSFLRLEPRDKRVEGTSFVDTDRGVSTALLGEVDGGRSFLCILHDRSGVTVKLVGRFPLYAPKRSYSRGSVFSESLQG